MTLNSIIGQDPDRPLLDFNCQTGSCCTGSGKIQGLGRPEAPVPECYACQQQGQQYLVEVSRAILVNGIYRVKAPGKPRAKEPQEAPNGLELVLTRSRSLSRPSCSQTKMDPSAQGPTDFEESQNVSKTGSKSSSATNWRPTTVQKLIQAPQTDVLLMEQRLLTSYLPAAM